MKTPLLHSFFVFGFLLYFGVSGFNLPASANTGQVGSAASPEPLRLEEARIQEFAVSDQDLIVAYYGRPNAPYMGIVGRHSKEDIVSLVKLTAGTFQEAAPARTVKPAVYLIYGTCQPEGRIGYMSDRMTRDYIEYAMEQDTLVILDHQIGIYSLQAVMDRLLPYLAYPNVHLALDFEWRTAQPMKEIGFVTGEELNWIQAYMQSYMIDKGITGKRYLIFHQFKPSMLRNPEHIAASPPEVGLIHSTSGWGSPALKASTHAMNARITQIAQKGFKLWYHYSDKPGIHYDSPLMTPAQVLALSPPPMLVMYQ